MSRASRELQVLVSNLPRDSLGIGPLRSGRGVVVANSGRGPAVIDFETV